ncbi:histidine phosphatase family protein [Williamsia sp. M5A3_1d]
MRFGAESCDLDDRGRRDARAVGEAIGERPAVVLSGPEASVVETAQALGDRVAVVEELRSIDLGSWTGRAPDEIATDALALWFSDVTSAPHGGESVADFVARVAAWIAPRIGPTDGSPPAPLVVVVAKPVVQAVVAHLGTAGVAGYFSVDIRPASVHTIAERTPLVRGL